jgi:hypothetical protein
MVVELSWKSASLYYQDAPCFADIAFLQVNQARIEGRSEAEAAAAERVAAALARERAERDMQVHSSLCTCGSPLRCASLLLHSHASDRQQMKVRCTTAARSR